MFDLSSSELLLIAVVALIVIGPKDLPKMVKTLALYVRKARSLAREFQSGIEEIAREAELEEIKQGIESSMPTDLHHELEQSIDPGGATARALDLQAETAAGSATAANPAPAPTSAGPAAGSSEAVPFAPAQAAEPLAAAAETDKASEAESATHAAQAISTSEGASAAPAAKV